MKSNRQLSLPFEAGLQNPERAARHLRGRRAYLAGQSAEDTVCRQYEGRGLACAARRWRGGGGEIDLIFRDGASCIFVEVKQSRTFDRAAQALGQRQIKRLIQAASVFIGDEPKGELTDVRFDVALVNGRGETEIIENALMAA